MIKLKEMFGESVKTETVETGRCLRPDCGRAARIRGLCHSCYNCALKLVKRGLVTWTALEDSGKALPAKKFEGKPGVRMRWFLGK